MLIRRGTDESVSAHHRRFAQMLFAGTFFVCRIIIGPFLTFYTLASPSSVGLVKVGGFLL